MALIQKLYESSMFVVILSILIGVILLVTALILLIKGSKNNDETKLKKSKERVSVDYEIKFVESTEIIE